MKTLFELRSYVQMKNKTYGFYKTIRFQTTETPQKIVTHFKHLKFI